MIGGIAVSAAIFAIDAPYSYRIPPALADQARPGVRVLVPFGRGNRPTEGFLLTVEPGDGEKLKAVTQVLDDAPVLGEAELRLAAFLRERYFCTMYEAARALLPAGLWYRQKRYCRLKENYLPVAAPITGPALEPALAALRQAGGSMEYGAYVQKLNPGGEKTLGRLLTAGLVEVYTDVQALPDKSQELAALAVPAAEALAAAQKKKRSAAQQAAVLEFMAHTGSACVKEICYYTGAAAPVVRRLEKLGFLTLERQSVYRQPEVAVQAAAPMDLNPEQEAACRGLCGQMDRADPGVALLYGVTGSGKTAVYLKLIRRVLAQGRTALLLVPEIALTPQLMRLFVSQLGDQVAVLHSGLSLGERYDQWRRIRAGDAQVVIGARSAVFAPLRDPGLLIVDEEQEHSYKSENPPGYHAREVAIYRGAQTGALVVLGSATPSMESMYRATTGVYGLYTLKNRYGGAVLPTVEIADMKPDLLDGSSGSLGSVLRRELEQNLADGQQSILFINRRGSSRLMMCTGCGYVPKCPRCSVSLTLHAANGRLMCHYCGHSQPAPERCPECGGRLRPLGTGTQKVQQELEALYPGVEVLRMDTDVITAVNTHDALLRRFEQKRIPILVGTQMVAKGLNLKNVTLVGVLDADMSLYVDDFRAAENTFDLATQVVGRAGRGQARGRAVLQTMTPGSTVLRLAANQDYDGFYQLELGLRQGRTCPPFCDLITLTFSGLDLDQTQNAAVRFRRQLEQSFARGTPQNDPITLLGPAAAAVARVNLVYRFRLTLACRNSRALRRCLAEFMRQAARDKQNKGVSVYADVNAYD